MSELSKAALATGKPILVLCHEGPLAAARAIAPSPCYFVSLYDVELVDGDLAFDFSFFVHHYFLPPAAAPVFEVSSCLLGFKLGCLFFIKYLLPFLPWECPQQPVVW